MSSAEEINLHGVSKQVLLQPKDLVSSLAVSHVEEPKVCNQLPWNR